MRRRMGLRTGVAGRMGSRNREGEWRRGGRTSPTRARCPDLVSPSTTSHLAPADPSHPSLPYAMAPTTRSAAAVQSQEELIAQFKSLLEQEVGKVRDEARDEAAASNQRHAAELASVKADAEKRERALSARVDMQAIHIGRLNHDLALVAGLSEWPKDGYALVTRADGRPGLALELVSRRMVSFPLASQLMSRQGRH